MSTTSIAHSDGELCTRLARFRLPGEGPYRTVAIVNSTTAKYVIRGHGRTRREADRDADIKVRQFMNRSHFESA